MTERSPATNERPEPTDLERSVAAKLGDDPHAIAKRRSLLEANEAVIEEYVKDYEAVTEDEDGCEGLHQPTEGERYLIQDAINGLLADENFVRTFNAWQDEVRRTTESETRDSGWRPVTDNEPPSRVPVWGTAHAYNNPANERWCAEVERHGDIWYMVNHQSEGQDKLQECYRPTHWMPLPEAPK